MIDSILLTLLDACKELVLPGFARIKAWAEQEEGRCDGGVI
jgi:hypothetical protein